MSILTIPVGMIRITSLTDNSFIIFDDADLDLAVDSVVTIKFRAAGQTCISAVRDYH